MFAACQSSISFLFCKKPWIEYELMGINNDNSHSSMEIFGLQPYLLIYASEEEKSLSRVDIHAR
jgi:hypothetical protein